MKRRVKGFAVALVLTLALSGCGAPAEQAGPRVPRVVSQEVVDARTDKLVIDSPATGGEQDVWVVKPTGWTKGSTGWRGLYLLHGCCSGGAWDWLRTGEVAKATAGMNAVVIVPEGGPMGWYSDWKKGPAWETFHMSELPGLVESRYGVGSYRAVAGFSMGGLGAFDYAARHPGMFDAAAALSGVLDVRDDVGSYESFFRSNGADTRDVWGEPDEWAAHNPTDLAARLKGVRLYVTAGDGHPGPLDDDTHSQRFDYVEFSILKQDENFVAAAKKAGVEVTTDFYGPGTHTWPYFIRSFQRALPLLLP
jgi:diacylglycerol O-acyltransferase / trehalose O-mycolyltransferase